MSDHNNHPQDSNTHLLESKLSLPAQSIASSNRPDKVSMGSGLPLSRKLNDLHTQQMEFCRITTLTDNIAEFEIPKCFALLSFTRRRVREFVRSMTFTPDQLQDIMLAVGEAATNAMKHGCLQNPCSVRIRMEKHPDSLHIFVLDDGVNFSLDEWLPLNSGSLDENGRGIGCMKAVMDEVIFHIQQSGNCVEMIKYLGGNCNDTEQSK